jgi:adenylate cyclase, class 2
MIEVELKFEITPTAWSRLKQYLAPMKFVHHVHNSDHYYDAGDHHLFAQAVFVRMRNQSTLQFKFNEQADVTHTHCMEHTFALDASIEQIAQMNTLFSRFLPQWRSAQSVQEAIFSNGLYEIAHIENHRTHYVQEDMVVCIDRVEGLGNFLELEILCPDEKDVPQILARLEDTAMGMALRPVYVGYVERWLQKYRPSLYQKGKYREELSPDSQAG